MTNQYPPYQPPHGQPPHGRPPRKLERSRSDRVVSGVCGGVANYLNLDPTLVRVLTVILTFVAGFPILIYLIAIFLMPEEDAPPSGGSHYPSVSGPQWSYGPYQQGNEGAMPPQQSYAPAPWAQAGPPSSSGATSPEDRAVWGAAGAPWEQPSHSNYPTAPAANPEGSGPAAAEGNAPKTGEQR